MTDGSQHTSKILVVDDDIIITSLIEKILKGTGYNIIEAYNGEEALRKVSEENPDLIILDIMMPKIDGFEVCRRLKSNEKTRPIPIVMLTSKDFLEDKIRGLEIGADDFITKPFNAKEFLVRIKRFIGKGVDPYKKAEEEELEVLEKMSDGVAHEIRKPIVAIGGFAKRMRDKLPDEDNLRVYANQIIHEVERLEIMLNEIVKLQNIVISIRESVDIKEILDTVLKELHIIMEEKRITVNKHYPTETTLIPADSQNLKVVFFNVIENALEAMEDGGTLTLEIGLKPKQATIKISDSGRGIPKDQISKISRPFYTSKMTGAGMGLSTVKHILELHGGDMKISSKQNVGTQVTIGLPKTGDIQI